MATRDLTILRDGSFVDIDGVPAGELVRADDIRTLKIDGLVPDDQSEPIDCSGFDYAIFYAADVTGTGPIELQVYDEIGGSSFQLEEGLGAATYLAATAQTAGYCLALPGKIRVLSPATGPTSVDVVVELHKRCALGVQAI